MGSDPKVPPMPRTLTVRHLHGLELALHKLRLKIRYLRRSKYRSFSFGAFRLDESRLIKYGGRVRPTEATTMEFIRRNTNIPVPRVLDVFKFNGMTHILQEYIDGDLLVDVWSTMDLEAQQQCMQQLKEYIDELRSLPPPHPGKVEAVDGACCLDDKIWSGGWGPFDNIDSFNDFFGYEVFRSDPSRYPEIQDPLKKIAGRKWRTVFSHGDLGPHNILWKDGRIVSIIDWECAGWLPEYWDYTRSYFGSIRSSPGWWEMFQEISVQYPDELEVEKCIPLYVTRLF